MHTLPALHRETCLRMGARVALRYKRHGLYHDLTWTEYRRQADCAAAGLIQLGIAAGDRVGILSENRYEWLIADHAILSAGAADVPLHAPLAPKQVEYQLGHSGAKGIFVSNQAQADKLFAVVDSLPQLEFLVSFDPIAVPTETRLTILTWNGLKHRPAGGQQPGCSKQSGCSMQEILSREAALSPESLATIIYTSGTTGNPKGVMLSHGNLLTNAVATGEISFLKPEYILLSWLPYSHIYARTVDHYLATWAGITVALAESIDTLVTNLAEVQPHWLTAVPRFYEKVWNSVAALEPAARQRELWRIFGPRIRQLSSGGAPLPRHVCEGFFAADIPILEGYGLTESSPVISFNTVEAYRFGSVGRTIPGVEVKIADDGEILTRGPHVMQGYWNNPEATAAAVVDGWLHTGDVGTLDSDGFLTITDRKKDLFVTSGGKNIAPSEIERLLTSDPCIDQAVLYGDGRQFVSALIVPNFAELESLAKMLDCRLESNGEFIGTPEIIAYIGKRIDAVMQAVSNPERVKKFLLLSRPFAVDADELTATLKVRRRHIIAKYEEQLAALYENDSIADCGLSIAD